MKLHNSAGIFFFCTELQTASTRTEYYSNQFICFFSYRVIRCKGNFCNNDTATIEGSRNDELCDESGCFKTTSTATTIITTTITTSGSPSSWLKSTKLQCFYFLGGILLHMLFFVEAVFS